MEPAHRLILLAATGLNLALTAEASAQGGGGADQKVAADKLVHDRASGNTVAARQALDKVKNDRAQMRQDRAELDHTSKQRVADEAELRQDERLDRKTDKKP